MRHYQSYNVYEVRVFFKYTRNSITLPITQLEFSDKIVKHVCAKSNTEAENKARANVNYHTRRNVTRKAISDFCIYYIDSKIIAHATENKNA